MDVLNESADIFANSSTETVAENIDYSLFLNQQDSNSNYELSLKPDNSEVVRIARPFCTSSPIAECSTMFSASGVSNTSMYASFVTNQFVSEACHAPITLYCPFCPDEFKLEFLLKDHIKFAHPIELKTVVRRSYYDNEDNGVEFNPCPFCHAKFYVKELLPKHIVRKHQDSVMSMFTDVAPDKYMHCPFCSHKVFTRHSKMLINHIEKKHFVEFQFAISSKCSNVMLDSDSLSFFDYKAPANCNSECSSLSKKMMGLTTKSGSNIKRIKSILKKTTSYPDGLNLDESMNEVGNLDKPDEDRNALGLSTFSLNNSSIMERRSARRRLRFELPAPDSPLSDEEHDKENSIFNLTKKRNFSSEKNKLRWLNLFRFNKNKKDKKKDDAGKVKKSKSQKITKHSPEKCHKQSPKLLGRYKEKEVQTTMVYSNVGFRTEGVSHLPVTQFKCGLCFEGFEKNALLLEHLRRNHKGLKLMPQYRCGECDAKFFRNSFLVRHCWFHHTPKCLKNGYSEALR